MTVFAPLNDQQQTLNAPVAHAELFLIVLAFSKIEPRLEQLGLLNCCCLNHPLKCSQLQLIAFPVHVHSQNLVTPQLQIVDAQKLTPG